MIKSHYFNKHMTMYCDTADDEHNIWSLILTHVQSSAVNKLPSNKSIIVFGENESGKTSLIAKMQGNNDSRKGSGLAYRHLLVRDEYRDEQTQCGVWIVDGDCNWNLHLMKYALNEKTMSDTTIVLTASMTEPWDIIDALDKWTKVLRDHIENLNIKKERFRYYQQLIQKRYMEYVSPSDEIDGITSTVKLKSNLESSSINQSTNSLEEPLSDGVLIHNLGLDIIVVITKTDFMSVLKKDYDFKDESFDFIQQTIRKFCLKYGASLIYVSVKANINCDLLYKFLVHRIYGVKFKIPALVVEKDAIFIPNGWDNEKKIAILYENINSVTPDDHYNDVIKKPVNCKTPQRESETAEDDQIFLLKLQEKLKQNQTIETRDTLFRTPPNVHNSNDRRASLTTPTSGIRTMNATNISPDNEIILKTFFEGLLNRRSVGGSPSGGSLSGGSPSGGSLSGVSPRTSGSMPDNRSRTEVQEELSPMINDSNRNSNNSTPSQRSLDLIQSKHRNTK